MLDKRETIDIVLAVKNTKNKTALISQQLRRLIEQCGMTRYRLSKETGVSQSTLSKFINDPEFSLSLDAIDKLGTYLGWTITAPKEDAAGRPSWARGRKQTKKGS